MRTGTENKAKGKLDEVAGKVKQTFGEATNNQSMANRGAAQQVKGHAEQAVGSVQDAAADESARRSYQGQAKSHDIREKITSTAQNVKEKIQEKVDRHRNDPKY